MSAFEEAKRRVEHPLNPVESAVDQDVGIRVPVAGAGSALCGGGDKGLACDRRAGVGTLHPGVGACRRHESRTEREIGAWMVAHSIATELEISPWEALLLCVRRAAGWSQWYTARLAAVSDAEELKPGGGAWAWVQGAERATAALARYSKLAVDAGVAAMLVQQAQTEGARIAQVLNTALEAVDLPPELEAAMRTALRDALENSENQTPELLAR